MQNTFMGAEQKERRRESVVWKKQKRRGGKERALGVRAGFFFQV